MTARPAPVRLATPGGVLTLEPLVPDAPTVELLHAWLTHPRSRFWDLLDADPERVRRAFAAVAEDVEIVADAGAGEEAERLVVLTQDVERCDGRQRIAVARDESVQLAAASVVSQPGQEPLRRLERRGIGCAAPERLPLRGESRELVE